MRGTQPGGGALCKVVDTATCQAAVLASAAKTVRSATGDCGSGLSRRLQPASCCAALPSSEPQLMGRSAEGYAAPYPDGACCCRVWFGVPSTGGGCTLRMRIFFEGN